MIKGVFGQNIVRQPSKHLDFETILNYTKEIFNLSNYTPKFQTKLLDMMPFFRLPVFGQNIVRQPSKHLDFETILNYTKEIFNLSNYTPKFQAKLLDMMPFFRLPSRALQDNTIPDTCFMGEDKAILNVRGESLF
jgi:hypothetical protein